VVEELLQEEDEDPDQRVRIRIQMNECLREMLETVDRMEISRYGRVIRRPNRLSMLNIRQDRNHHERGKHPIREPLQVVFRKRKKGFPGECPICLVRTPTIRTQCGHCFCRCIFKVCWKPGSVCPYCRQGIRVLEVSDPDLYEIMVLLRPVIQPRLMRFRT